MKHPVLSSSPSRPFDWLRHRLVRKKNRLLSRTAESFWAYAADHWRAEESDTKPSSKTSGQPKSLKDFVWPNRRSSERLPVLTETWNPDDQASSGSSVILWDVFYRESVCAMALRQFAATLLCGSLLLASSASSLFTEPVHAASAASSSGLGWDDIASKNEAENPLTSAQLEAIRQAVRSANTRTLKQLLQRDYHPTSAWKTVTRALLMPSERRTTTSPKRF